MATKGGITDEDLNTSYKKETLDIEALHILLPSLDTPKALPLLHNPPLPRS